MIFNKIVLIGIILGSGFVCVGCQTQTAGGSLAAQKAPTSFVEEPDTGDFVADQLRNRATNFYNEKY